MATTIITKHSATAKDPQPSQLERGELAIDLARKNIYTKDASDAVVQLAESQWKDNGNDIYYNDGNVGINRTPNSNYQLDVAGSARFTTGANVADEFSEIYLGGQTVNNRQAKLRKGTGGTESTALQFYSATGGSSAETKFYRNNVDLSMTIDDSGILSFSSTSSASFPPRSINCYSNGYMYVTGGSSGMILADGSTGSTRVRINSQDLQFETNGSTQMTIDDSGNVGIGGEPGTRTAGEYLERAKTRLEGWKTTFDDRLKAEPKADKKAVTLEITDGDFSVFPKAEVLAEKMAERAIGGGNARLQVAGDIYGSGHLAINAPVQSNISIYSSQNGSRTHAGWFQANGNTGTAMQIRGTASAQSSATCIIETTGSSPTGNTLVVNHKGTGRALDVTGDGYFSGNVNANAFNSNNFRGVAFYNTPAGTNGIRFSTAGQLRPTDNTGTAKDDVLSLGSENFRFKDAHFSGTVHAQQFMRDGNPVPTTRDLIETLDTLRNATKDEETLEGLRDALGDAIGGLIQKFEAIQA